MLFRVFFRPEEDRLFSERVDDALVIQVQEIHIRHEYDRLGSSLSLTVIVEIAVYRQLHRRFAVGAFGPDRDRELLVP